MTAFTAAQSSEIDDRIVEMMTAVMGAGQYSRACRDIADRRAAAVAASAIEFATASDDRAARLEGIAEQALALTERALALASRAEARLVEHVQRASLKPLSPEDSDRLAAAPEKVDRVGQTVRGVDEKERLAAAVTHASAILRQELASPRSGEGHRGRTDAL